jgi:hypothetical protein
MTSQSQSQEESCLFPRFQMYQYILDIWFDSKAIDSGAFTYRFFGETLEKIQDLMCEFLFVLDTGGAMISYGMKDHKIYHLECSKAEMIEKLIPGNLQLQNPTIQINHFLSKKEKLD